MRCWRRRAFESRVPEGQIEHDGLQDGLDFGTIMSESRETSTSRRPTGDGTRELLVGGSSILAIGLAALALTVTVFGGINYNGAHSNTGWFLLIVGAMCVPFGLMLTVLGTAKWLRGRQAPDSSGPAHDRHG